MEGLEKQGAIIYVRNAVSGQNMEWQHQLLSDHAKHKNYEIFRTFVDDGISGATTDRPGFNALLHFSYCIKIFLRTFLFTIPMYWRGI